jgi:hypothetical protein
VPRRPSHARGGAGRGAILAWPRGSQLCCCCFLFVSIACYFLASLVCAHRRGASRHCWGRHLLGVIIMKRTHCNAGAPETPQAHARRPDRVPSTRAVPLDCALGRPVVLITTMASRGFLASLLRSEGWAGLGSLTGILRAACVPAVAVASQPLVAPSCNVASACAPTVAPSYRPTLPSAAALAAAGAAPTLRRAFSASRAPPSSKLRRLRQASERARALRPARPDTPAAATDGSGTEVVPAATTASSGEVAAVVGHPALIVARPVEW